MKEKIVELLETTELPIEEIAKTLGIGWKRVANVFKEYPYEFRAERKFRTKSNSKKGEKAAWFGKYGTEHPNYKGVVSDCKGYSIVLKPSWYTGRASSKHVFEHHVVMCQALGITEIPSGFCVHHINGTKTDNDLSNLALLTIGAHSKLHMSKGATTKAAMPVEE